MVTGNGFSAVPCDSHIAGHAGFSSDGHAGFSLLGHPHEWYWVSLVLYCVALVWLFSSLSNPLFTCSAGLSIVTSFDFSSTSCCLAIPIVDMQKTASNTRLTLAAHFSREYPLSISNSPAISFCWNSLLNLDAANLDQSQSEL